MTIATMKARIDKLNSNTHISLPALVAAMRAATGRGGLAAEITCECILEDLCAMEWISPEQLLVAQAVIAEEDE